MTHTPPLDEAIALVYETVLDPSAWHPALAALASAFAAASAVRFRFDARTTEPTGFYSHGFDTGAVDRYHAHYYNFDPAALPALQSAVGQWHGGSELLDRRVRAHQPYATDFALPSGIGWVGGAKIEATSPPTGLWLSLQRRPDDRPFGAQAERTFAQLLPHLQRAARMERQMATLARGNALAHAALDAFAAAVCVVDAARRLHLHNRAAGQLLTGRGPLQSRDGRLACAHAGTDDQLARAIARACARRPAGAALQLGAAHDPLALHVMVLPLPPHHTLASVFQEPLALIIAADPQAPHLGREVYQGLLGLSDAEAALLHALVHGRSLDDFAADRGVSRNTVRTQLYSIFAKTGVDSQARLVGLAKTLPAASPPASP